MGRAAWGVRVTQPSLPDPDLADVGVGILRIYAAVLPDILKGVGHVATTAAVVVGHTVHQVLRAEREQLPCLPLQLPLQCTHRAEGPARATLALWERKG